MPFDLNKLPSTIELRPTENGALYERRYRRYREQWYSPFSCRHKALSVFAEDLFPADPSGTESNVLQTRRSPESDDALLLMTSKCLVCCKAVLDGRLRSPDGSLASAGVLYILTRNEFTAAPRDISNEELLKFHEKAWKFQETLLADFNKLTIAIAVAAVGFFDKFPLVFYVFMGACFVLIALYVASYIGQDQISKKFFQSAGKRMIREQKSVADEAARYLQILFGITIVVMLCLMISAERKIFDERRQPQNQSVEPPGTKTSTGH